MSKTLTEEEKEIKKIKHREYMRKYYHLKKEKVRAINKKSYEKNKDNRLKSVSRYKKTFRATKIGRAEYLLYAYKCSDIKYGRGQGDLTREWIVENIFTKPCVHCGETDWTKLGCNRLDNTKPHTKDNVEPCCYRCNSVLAGLYTANKKEEINTYDIIDNLTGEVVYSFISQGECAKFLGISSSCVCIALNKRKNIKGYNLCSRL